MPHLRLEAPEEWLEEEFIRKTGVDARKLLEHLVDVVTSIRMPREGEPEGVPLINRKNLKHALVPLRHTGVAGDLSKGFLHLTFSAGNDTPGRTAEVRRGAAEALGDAIDTFVGDKLASVTVHVLDIDRDRGYSTAAERRKRREATP
jgi:hypothetical protein